MRQSSVFRYVLLALLAIPLTAVADDEVRDVKLPAGAEMPDPSRRPPAEQVVPGIVGQTNAFRKENKLAELKIDAQLTVAAQKFAEFMAAGNRYGHTADGKEPGDRATAAGYEICLLSENIAYRFSSDGYEKADELVKEFVEGWISSPPHCANMLEEHVTQIGVGVAWSAEGFAYGVQLFGRPRSMMIDFSVNNRANKAVRYQVDNETYDLPPRATRTHGHCVPVKVRLEGSGETFDVAADAAFVVAIKDGQVLMQRGK